MRMDSARRCLLDLDFNRYSHKNIRTYIARWSHDGISRQNFPFSGVLSIFGAHNDEGTVNRIFLDKEAM